MLDDLNLNFLEAVGVGLQESFSTRLLKPTDLQITIRHRQSFPRSSKL